MKVYYKEDDIYPGTYNFKDDTVGAEPDGWTVIDGAGCATTVIALLDGHRKVVQMFDESAVNRAYMTRSVTQLADQTFEMWVGKSSIVGDSCSIILWESGTRVVQLLLSNDDLRYLPNGGPWGNIKVDFIVADELFHLRIVLDDTANTFDCYVNGLLEGNNLGYENNSVTSANLIQFSTETAPSTDYKFYVDAIGLSSDTNYNIGDNRNDDYHYYNREQLTDIIQYPTIISHNNMYGLCSVVLRDFEGGLFSTWDSKDSTEFVIEDESDNKLFRGYLINKIFGYKQLELFLGGLGIKLEWEPFYRDYVLETGKVRIVPATSVLTMYDDLDENGAYTDAGEDFAWPVDYWIFDQSVGLLLIDSTKTLDSKTWECSAISQTNGTLVDAGVNPLDDPNDDDTYHITETKPWDAFITPVMTAAGGDEVPTTKILNKIVINYLIHYKHGVQLGHTGKIYLKIRDSDNEWVIIREKSLVGHSAAWLSLSGNFPILRTSAELAKFLTTDNGNWDECLELKLEVIYSGGPTASVEIKLDFLTVEIHYEAYAIAPIMEAITDSTASTITCSGIAKWDETGLSVNDDFKIGQNTVQIVEDIGAASGLAIVVMGQEISGGGTETLRPDGDDTTEWANSGGGTHTQDVDEIVVEPNAGDGNNIYSSTDGAEDIFTMETHAMGGNNVVKKIELWTYANPDSVLNVARAYFHTTSTGWSTDKYPLTSTYGSYSWKKVTWDNLSLDQADLDSLKIKYLYEEVLNPVGHVHIDLFYIVITYGVYNPFTKFIARAFRGTHCIDALNAVCELEGAIWCEDYVNNRIKVIAPGSFESSDIVLTDGLRGGVTYEDICNQVRRVDVFGSVNNADYPIHEFAEDITVSGFRSIQIINERIMTSGDAKEIADAQLALLKDKRPSIRIPLIGTYPELQLGTTVNLTFVRPTIGAADYPIRMIERSEFGIAGILTVVYCGLGETPDDEKIGMTIRKIGYIANRAMSDRLI